MSFYITTPIYYVNAQPHLGHAYSTVIADTAARFRRLCGDDVRFQTGTDEHGDKVVAAAEKEGLSPRQYADRISALFREAWPPLAIEPDHFIRTTDPVHVATVQKILQEVYDRGDIYFGSYSGLYCQGCERFLTEKELTAEGTCPDHQTVPQEITEENYFFRMSKYQGWLLEHIEQNPEFIAPERYRNEVLSFLREPLEDLCISRPTTRLTWGIPLPFDERYVTYVWFDALINYLTGLGFPDGADFARYWPAAEHVIAKDILKPHAIYWPTMLKAMGLEPYKRLHVHGYWNVNATKMSKSIGNVVRPAELVAEYGVDAVRYFLLREMSFGLDASFSTEALVDRQNSDLANDLGNLVSRSLTMIDKFGSGKIPEPGPEEESDAELRAAAAGMLAEYRQHMLRFEFHRALQAVWAVIGLANRYIVTNAPWELAKEPEKAARLGTVLYNLAEILRLVGLVMGPVMPETAAKMFAALGMKEQQSLAGHDRWGLTVAGTRIAPAAQLFPRIDKKKPAAAVPVAEAKAGKAKEGKKEKPPATKEEAPLEGAISFEQFKAVDLRVAEVTAAERIPKSDRLLKLTVLAPEERTIVAGIAEHYQPEEVVGRQVIIVANLKPSKLMGVVSQGMVLAVRHRQGEEEKLLLSAVAGQVAPGSKVS